MFDKFLVTNVCLEKIQTAMETNQASGETIEVKLPSQCCNCNAEGHFASDLKCPNKLAYIQARREKASGGRMNAKQHSQLKQSNAGSRLVREEVSFAEMLKSGKFQCSPSVTNTSRKSDKTQHSGRPGPSGSLNTEEPNVRPFSVEEITALTFDIVSSLRDVRNLPRDHAFMDRVIHRFRLFTVKISRF